MKKRMNTSPLFIYFESKLSSGMHRCLFIIMLRACFDINVAFGSQNLTFSRHLSKNLDFQKWIIPMFENDYESDRIFGNMRFPCLVYSCKNYYFVFSKISLCFSIQVHKAV
jgi:hypothetical protein